MPIGFATLTKSIICRGDIRADGRKRMANIPESGTVKITNIVSNLKAQGIDVISFSVGEPISILPITSRTLP